MSKQRKHDGTYTRDFMGHQVRMLMRDGGEAWFVANDLCEALEFGNPHQVLARVDEDDRGLTRVIDAIGRLQQTNIINEPGMYQLVMGSRKPEARKFRKWLKAITMEGNARSSSSSFSLKPDEKEANMSNSMQLFESSHAARAADGTVTRDFMGHQVRMLMRDGGEVWFVANDLCEALEIGNPHDAMTRLDEEDLGSTEVLDGRGVMQQTNIINEPGMYQLVMGSRKPEARKFRKWVANVLVELRKTGTYTVPGAKPKQSTIDHPEVSRISASIAAIANILEEAGVGEGHIRTFEIEETASLLGLPQEVSVRAQKMLPGKLERIANLTPTALGKMLEPVMSPVRMNMILQELGLQKRVNGEWTLTDAGKKYSEMKEYNSGRHSGFRLLWQAEVLEDEAVKAYVAGNGFTLNS